MPPYTHQLDSSAESIQPDPFLEEISMFTHHLKKRWPLLAIIPLLGLALLAACQPASETIEVTRVVVEVVTEP